VFHDVSPEDQRARRKHCYFGVDENSEKKSTIHSCSCVAVRPRGGPRIWSLGTIQHFQRSIFFAANVCCIVPKPHAVRVSAAVARCEAKNDAAAREGGSGIGMDGAGNCDTQGV